MQNLCHRTGCPDLLPIDGKMRSFEALKFTVSYKVNKDILEGGYQGGKVNYYEFKARSNIIGQSHNFLNSAQMRQVRVTLFVIASPRH